MTITNDGDDFDDDNGIGGLGGCGGDAVVAEDDVDGVYMMVIIMTSDVFQNRT